MGLILEARSSFFFSLSSLPESVAYGKAVAQWRFGRTFAGGTETLSKGSDSHFHLGTTVLQWSRLSLPFAAYVHMMIYKS